MAGSNRTRMVLLGKTGSGKSSLGNTLLGDSLLKAKSSPNSETAECQAESKTVNGIHTTVVDTPGFFDTNIPEDKLKLEVVKCIAECSPGPHAFLIVLRVDRYTEQEKEVINNILHNFSEEVLQYAVVVFTYGDQLDQGEKIEDFVQKNADLTDLVQKCGGRCHVVDNKYWNNNDDDYRNNEFQVTQLLNTIERMKQSRGYYTNQMLQKVEELKKKSKNKDELVKKLMCIFTGVAAGALLGALFGASLTRRHPVLGALTGALVGGGIGYGVGEQSSTPGEAALKTVETVSAVGKGFMQTKDALQGGDSKDKKE